MEWLCYNKDENDWVKECMVYEVKGVKQYTEEVVKTSWSQLDAIGDE